MSAALFRSYPFLAAVLVIASFACSSHADARARSHHAGDATVEILPALSAGQAAPLSFGRLLPSGEPGVATVSPSGSLSCSAGMRCFGGAAAARFVLRGGSGLVVVTLATETRLTGPEAATVILRPLASASQVVLSDGAASVDVGGSLAIGGDQMPGNYAGQFHINFDYQ